MRRNALVVIVLAACASVPPLWTPAARTSATSCTNPGADPTPPWRLVGGAGFTFCVPSDWSASDDHTWQGGGGSITWSLANPASALVYRQVITDRPVQPGDIAQEGPNGVFSVTPCSSRRMEELIGGQHASLMASDCPGQQRTYANWATLALHFSGRAPGPATANLQLQVYRSVRFLPREQP